MSGRQSAAVRAALRSVAKGMRPVDAARKHKVAYSTIYRALAKLAKIETPPTHTQE